MGPKIALLVRNFPSDLSAGVCSVQLASRTESRLYVLGGPLPSGEPAGGRSEQSVDNGLLDSFGFVTEFAALEGVPVTCHMLGDMFFEEIAGFLISNSITCLVLGDWPPEIQAEQRKWVADLKKTLNEAPNRYYSDLQIIIAPPLDEEELEELISHSRRISRIVAKEK